MRRKDEAKAEDILAATLEEVQIAGLAGLSIEAVARRAGVATGTVYVYIKNKQALLDALYRDTKAKFVAIVLKGEDLPLRVAFANMTRDYIDYIIDHKAEIIFMGQMANSPYVSAETRETVELGVRPLIALLERGKAEHLLKDIDTRWMMSFITGVVRDMAALASGMSGEARAELKDRVATLCWDALRA